MGYCEFYRRQNENLFVKPKKHTLTHEDIERQIQEFERRGGKIQQVASYVSNFDNLKFNTPKHDVHEPYYKPVEAVHAETGEVVKYKSTNEVRKQGYSPSTIAKICKEKSDRIHKGYRWRYS